MKSQLSAAQRIHLIGIGGSGLSAIARLLLESGYSVSGSDRVLSPLAQELADSGVRVWQGHQAENVQGADLVVRSSAIPDDNVEVQAALAAGIPVLKRAQFLNRLTDDRLVIAIAGTHGKTTITSMIAWLLVSLEQDPSYIIGGTAKNLGGRNARAGNGRAFVIEADEYDRMFLGLNPDVIVVSGVDYDHPDCFPTPQDYSQAFVEFVHQLRPDGLLLAAHDSAGAYALMEAAPAGTRALSYGMNPQASYSAVDLAANSYGGFDYTAVYNPGHGSPVMLARISLQVPGQHNVRNSLAALAAIHQIFAGEAQHDVADQAARALEKYIGTGRRFDILGEANGITVIDDYAHHPAKIRATLSAARARFARRRIWAVWQPHTYSRTLAFLQDFSGSFSDADQVLVTEVYAAREKAQDFDNFTAAQAVAKMDHPAAQFTPTLADATRVLLDQLAPGDVLLVLSAGDANQIATQVLSAIQERKNQNA